MWTELRARRLGGFKFVRQAPVDRYFVDFLCREHRIVVEIDGGTHGSDIEVAYDNTRSEAIEALGYRIFRVHNIDIYENLDRVLNALLDACLSDRWTLIMFVLTAAPHPALRATFSPQAGRR